MPSATDPVPPSGPSTKARVLDAALQGFAAHGYEATSLDTLAAELGIRKQTILYHFSSKDQLLDAVIDAAGLELIEAVDDALAEPVPPGWREGTGWWRVEAVVRSVFRLAGRRPELPGLMREVTRLGPPATTRLREQFAPFLDRATDFLLAEMAAGAMRPQDPLLLLLNAYSTVIGAATEMEVLRSLGVEPTSRVLVRRRSELLDFLRSALLPAA